MLCLLQRQVACICLRSTQQCTRCQKCPYWVQIEPVLARIMLNSLKRIAWCMYRLLQSFETPHVRFVQKQPTRCNSVSKFIISYLYEAQHVSGDTPPIIRSLKLHQRPLVLYTWKVVGRVVGGRCQAESAVRLHHLILCLTTSSDHTSNNPPRMQNQRLLVQFQAPGDGRCVARNMLSFI